MTTTQSSTTDRELHMIAVVLLATGGVIVRLAESDYFRARVRSRERAEPHYTSYSGLMQQWSCDCSDPEPCAHIEACAIIWDPHADDSDIPVILNDRR